MRKYFETIKKLWIILKPFHRDFYYQLFLILILQIITISAVTTLSKMVTHLTERHFYYACIFLVATLSIDLFSQVIGSIKDKQELRSLGQNIYQYLQEFSLKRVLSMNISQLTEDHSQYKLSVIGKGENATQTIIDTLFLNVLPVVVFIFLTIGYLFYQAPIIALWDTVTAIVVIVWITYFNKNQFPIRKKNNDNWDENLKVKSELFQHLLLIKYFGKEIDSIKKYIQERKSKADYHIWVWSQNIQHYTKRTAFVYASEHGGTLIAIYLYYIGHIQIGTIYLIFNLSGRIFNQVTSLVGQMRQLPLRFIEVEKYLHAIEREPLFKEDGSTKFTPGTIVFKDVSFKYPKGEIYAFKHLSLTIEKGKRVAFVGHSGSGKSTIIKLLLRAYEYEGSITIDGKELSELNAVSLRNHIGYVEQHVDLFDDTLEENILFGVVHKDKKAAKKELETIAQLARIDEFYHRLGTKKFDTVLGEKGIKLSGGERQRVGIARAIIKNPEILIFDEATSSLDTENEKYVVEAINNVSQGKTTIVVAHRLSTIIDADVIFVMSKGIIVGTGSHNELMETCEEYKNLVNNQILN